MSTTNTAAVRTSKHSYTIRAKDGAPAIVWTSEVYFVGQGWRADLWRNGHLWAESVAVDDVLAAISYSTWRNRAQARRVADKLRGW